MRYAARRCAPQFFQTSLTEFLWLPSKVGSVSFVCFFYISFFSFSLSFSPLFVTPFVSFRSSNGNAFGSRECGSCTPRSVSTRVRVYSGKREPSDSPEGELYDLAISASRRCLLEYVSGSLHWLIKDEVLANACPRRTSTRVRCILHDSCSLVRVRAMTSVKN